MRENSAVCTDSDQYSINGVAERFIILQFEMKSQSKWENQCDKNDGKKNPKHVFTCAIIAFTCTYFS